MTNNFLIASSSAGAGVIVKAPDGIGPYSARSAYDGADPGFLYRVNDGEIGDATAGTGNIGWDYVRSGPAGTWIGPSRATPRDGVDGINGTNGTDGVTPILVDIYILVAPGTTPATPVGGEIAITGTPPALTVTPPPGWSANRPAGSGDLVMSRFQGVAQGASVTIISPAWGEPMTVSGTVTARPIVYYAGTGEPTVEAQFNADGLTIEPGDIVYYVRLGRTYVVGGIVGDPVTTATAGNFGATGGAEDVTEGVTPLVPIAGTARQWDGATFAVAAAPATPRPSNLAAPDGGNIPASDPEFAVGPREILGVPGMQWDPGGGSSKVFFVPDVELTVQPGDTLDVAWLFEVIAADWGGGAGPHLVIWTTEDPSGTAVGHNISPREIDLASGTIESWAPNSIWLGSADCVFECVELAAGIYYMRLQLVAGGTLDAGGITLRLQSHASNGPATAEWAIAPLGAYVNSPVDYDADDDSAKFVVNGDVGGVYLAPVLEARRHQSLVLAGAVTRTLVLPPSPPAGQTAVREVRLRLSGGAKLRIPAEPNIYRLGTAGDIAESSSLTIKQFGDGEAEVVAVPFVQE